MQKGVAETTGLSRATVQRIIKKLADMGRLERSGSKLAIKGEIKEQKDIYAQMQKEINAMCKVAAWIVLKENEIW